MNLLTIVSLALIICDVSAFPLSQDKIQEAINEFYKAELEINRQVPIIADTFNKSLISYETAANKSIAAAEDRLSHIMAAAVPDQTHMDAKTAKLVNIDLPNAETNVNNAIYGAESQIRNIVSSFYEEIKSILLKAESEINKRLYIDGPVITDALKNIAITAEKDIKNAIQKAMDDIDRAIKNAHNIYDYNAFVIEDENTKIIPDYATAAGNNIDNGDDELLSIAGMGERAGARILFKGSKDLLNILPHILEKLSAIYNSEDA